MVRLHDRIRGVAVGGSLLAALLVAGVGLVPQAASAAGGKGSVVSAPPSIRLNQADPHLGDRVTFTATGGKRITVACYQGGVTSMVYSEDEAVGTSFLLGGTSSAWLQAGGPADCYAWLYTRSITRDTVASTYFHAGGVR